MIVKVAEHNEQAWAALCVKLWPHHTAQEMLAERREGNLPHEFLYSKEERAIAFLSLSLRQDYVEGTHSSPVGYIEGIYVEPEYRGVGIARELVQFARQWSMEKGCAELASDCILENEVSRAFHRAVGFCEANTIVHFTMDLERGG